MKIDCNDIEHIFNGCFKLTENTVIRSTQDEPNYQPTQPGEPLNCIFYTADSYASIMHEISHWCRAGRQRRTMHDYGYWYKEHGRTPAEQIIYVASESKTQALEWILCVAAGARVLIIPENQPISYAPSPGFKTQIYAHTMTLLSNGMPARAEIFKTALLKFYGRESIFCASLFQLGDL